MFSAKWHVAAIALAIGGAWFVVRLLIELVFPMIPFQTANSFPRIIVEMPFYYGIAWVYRVVSGSHKEPAHWGMTVGVATLEALSVGCIAAMACIILRRCRTRV